MELQSVSRLSGGPPPSRSPARSFESPVRGWQRRPSGGNHGGGGGGHNQSGDALDTTLELDSSDIYGHFEQFGAKALSTLGALGGAARARARVADRRRIRHPETKSVLAGFSLPGFLTLRTLVAKVGGVVLLLGAGLPVGGGALHPHAAIFAEQLLSLSYFRVLNDTPEFRHQMLSAAAAVGVSAAFGAPIGGIMFSIEATAAFYVTAHYWGAFFARRAARSAARRRALVAVLFTFAFSAACVGLPASNGLVTPSFAIGAGVGRLYGEVLRFAAAAAGAATSPFSPAGGYAIVGAAAFSVSVTGKISIGVVICELTGQLSYAIPVLFACVLGLAAGQVVEIDIYSMIARMKRLPHWPTLSAAADFALTVDDVFDRDEHLSVRRAPADADVRAASRQR
ncbi:voltage-gated chloride channel [Aureococcus anophagefferens]|nr:voltage-gated chloride channel [Aureococcus anophagefferens]